MARRSLALRPAPIVAVTGSVGKSTTTTFIAELLKTHMRVQVTEENMNLGWAVPATLLGVKYTRKVLPFVARVPVLVWRALVRPQPVDAFVLEIATNYPGDIPGSLRAFRPTIAVYTTLGNAHVGNFRDADTLLEEKSALIDALPDDGIAILRYDDERVRGLAARHRGRTLFYGFDGRCDVRMSEPVLADDGQHVTLTDAHGCVALTFPHIRQRHHLYAVMASWATGQVMGIPRERMAESVQGFSPLAGRGLALAGLRHTVVFDDSHNASPAAALAALDAFPSLAGTRRKVAVLGDMKELGAEAEQAHVTVGQRAGQVADLVAAVGEWAPAVARGVAATTCRQCLTYSDVDACIGEIEAWLADGDALLVKGSHSVNLQRLVKRLRVPPRSQEKAAGGHA